MAKAEPGLWAVWLWKLGMWGLVILFAFLYLGSVEKHGGDSGVNPTNGQNEPGSESVSQAEAQAFAKAVMSDTSADSTEVGSVGATGDAFEPSAVDAAIARAPIVQLPAQSNMAEVSGLAADRIERVMPESRPVVPSAPVGTVPLNVVSSIPVSSQGPGVSVGPGVPVVPSTGPAMSSVAPAAAPTAAPSTEPQPDVSGSAVDAPRAAVRETAAQRRARIMAEYRAMQKTAHEEMRKRWLSKGGPYPYGAYPQWGYPQGVPRRGYAPAGQ